MTTRETYSLIATTAMVLGCWLIGGWAAAGSLLAGMAFSHVNLDWIPAEPLDEE